MDLQPLSRVTLCLKDSELQAQPGSELGGGFQGAVRISTLGHELHVLVNEREFDDHHSFNGVDFLPITIPTKQSLALFYSSPHLQVINYYFKMATWDVRK